MPTAEISHMHQRRHARHGRGVGRLLMGGGAPRQWQRVLVLREVRDVEAYGCPGAASSLQVHVTREEAARLVRAGVKVPGGSSGRCHRTGAFAPSWTTSCPSVCPSWRGGAKPCCEPYKRAEVAVRRPHRTLGVRRSRPDIQSEEVAVSRPQTSNFASRNYGFVAGKAAEVRLLFRRRTAPTGSRRRYRPKMARCGGACLLLLPNRGCVPSRFARSEHPSSSEAYCSRRCNRLSTPRSKLFLNAVDKAGIMGAWPPPGKTGTNDRKTLPPHGRRAARVPVASASGRSSQATRALFDERGVQDAPMEEIARAVGINKALIYRHFGSQEELFVLTVASYLSQLAERFAEVDDSLEPVGGSCARSASATSVSAGNTRPFSTAPCRSCAGRSPSLPRGSRRLFIFQLGQAMSACISRLSRILAKGAEQGVFSVSDPDFVANLLYAQGLGAMHLARVQVGVRELAPGVPQLVPFSPEDVARAAVDTAFASSSRPAPKSLRPDPFLAPLEPAFAATHAGFLSDF